MWAWGPSWSWDLDHLYKVLFPLPKEAPYEIWHSMAKQFRRRCLNIVDGRTTDKEEHGYIISLPFDNQVS